jgi:hypothetical protein
MIQIMKPKFQIGDLVYLGPAGSPERGTDLHMGVITQLKQPSDQCACYYVLVWVLNGKLDYDMSSYSGLTFELLGRLT